MPTRKIAAVIVSGAVLGGLEVGLDRCDQVINRAADGSVWAVDTGGRDCRCRVSGAGPGVMLSLIPDLLPDLLSAGAILVALFGFGARQKGRGRHEAETKAKEADHETAEQIRNRVERDLDERGARIRRCRVP